MEIKTEVNTFLVEMECPKCKIGTMVKGNRGLSNSAGTFWPHWCKTCFHEETFKNISYPYYSYEKI